MPIVADAAAAIRADMSKFQGDLKKGLAGGEKQVQGFSGKLKGLLSPKNLLMGAAGGFLASELMQGMSSAINQAAEFNDAIGATGVIFGEEMIPGMEEWAESAAQNFGASKREAINAANVIATLGKSAGLAGEDLTGFSQEMVQLGGDLASMFGGTTQDAITAVGAALRGESEPIRRYGVLLDDATLRQKAFEMGLIDTTKNALTPQQRVLAAQASILEQTADAQGDFVRTSDGMANTQRELAAEMDNLVTEIGQKLLPIGLEFARFVKDVLIPALSFLADNVLGPVADGIGNIAGAFQEAAGDVHFFAMNFGEQGDAVHKTADRFGQDFDDLKDRIRDRMVETGETFEEAHGVIVGELEAARDEGSVAAWELQQEINAAAVAGTTSARTEAANVAMAIPDAIAENWEKIRQAGEDSVSAYAQGIFDNQDALNSEVEALLNHLDERLTPGEEISRLRGQKMQLMLARGIQAELGDEGAVAAIDELIDKINRQLNGLNGYGAGRNLVITLANGIRQNLGTASLAAYALATKVRNPVFIESEPKDPNSPLRGITKIGGNIVKTIADGIYGELGTGNNAAMALAGALVPSMGMGAMAMGGMGAGTTINYNLSVNGVPYEVRSPDEMIKTLMELGAFHEGRIG